MVEKNQVLILDITDMSLEGDGIGKTAEGYTFFVKGAVLGDKAEVVVTKANKTYGFAKAVKVLEQSPYRTEPICPVSRQCGGCTLSELSYSAQLAIKKDIVKNNLLKIGRYPEGSYILEDIISSPKIEEYRNKAQYPVAFENGRAIAGFYERRSHRVIACKDCKLQPKAMNEIVAACLSYINENQISVYDEKSHKGTVRNIYLREGSCGFMVCLVTNSEKPLPKVEKLLEKLKPYPVISVLQNINTKKTNVVLGDHNILLFGEEFIEEQIGDKTFLVSPLSFFQVNSLQVKNLYDKAKEYAQIEDTDTVFDLYCGVGSIGIYLADHAKKLIGVEWVESATQNAKKNAQRNGIKNAEFYAGDCGKIVKDLVAKGEKADVVIVDPPRKGCSEDLLDLIGEINPKRVVYISCNSATLARDVAILNEKGYTMTKCTPVDMFPHTSHVETIVLLSKLYPDDRIEVDLDLDELDITAAESKATYEEIKAYIRDKYGFKVSSLYIAQTKTKCGIIERINYNLSKKGTRVPKCPPDKENAIKDALRHFGMI